MNKDLDLTLIWFNIRKVTPKRYEILCVYRQWNGTYKITITSREKEEWNNDEGDFIAGWNHEFLHVILGEFVSLKVCNTYDKYLKLCDLYDIDNLEEWWL